MHHYEHGSVLRIEIDIRGGPADWLGPRGLHTVPCQLRCSIGEAYGNQSRPIQVEKSAKQLGMGRIFEEGCLTDLQRALWRNAGLGVVSFFANRGLTDRRQNRGAVRAASA